MQKAVTIINIILIVIFFALAAFQQSYRIGFEQIKIWDEASGAQNAIEMMDNKKYIVVHYDGEPDHWDVKPPLSLWFKIISYKIFGISEFAVRFPTIVSVWLTMLLLVIFAVRWLNIPEIAWFLLLIMASTWGYMGYHVARHGDPDAMLTFFVTGYILCFFIILESRPEKHVKYLILIGVFIVGAVYTKSISGIAPLAGIFLYTLLIPAGRKLLRQPNLYIAIAAVIFMILAYYLGRELLDPGYLKSVLQMELGLFGEYPDKIKHPEFIFYIDYLIEAGFKPWIFYIPICVIPLIFSKNRKHKRLLLYTLISAFTLILGYSLSVTKNEWYIAPVYPLLWIVLAMSFYEIFHLISKHIIPISAKIALILILVFLPVFTGMDRYIDIYRNNYRKEGDYIYEPERLGHYLRHIKTTYPEIKYLVAFTQRIPKQLKFYAKKYNYEDGTVVDIIEVLNHNLVNKKVFITDLENQELLISTYQTTLIDSTQYGKLFQIEQVKDSLMKSKEIE